MRQVQPRARPARAARIQAPRRIRTRRRRFRLRSVRAAVL